MVRLTDLLAMTLDVGLGRFIDISMHRDTECTDTHIDMLGAIL